MCLGGLWSSPGTSFLNILNFLWMVQQVSGKVPEGPRSPCIQLKDILVFIIQMLFFNKHAFGLLAPVYWYWYCLLAPVNPVWNNSAVLFRGGITARKIQLSWKHESGSFLVLLVIARMLQLSRKHKQ